MRKFLICLALVPFLTLFTIQKSVACGYDWVGDCSSAVHLRINGSLDSFIIADCPSGIPFNQLQLGAIQSLSLANAKAITWESCLNNVTAVRLKYRLYEQGGAGGGFQSLSLDQDYFTVLGPYTTRYRSKASNVDLTTGLTVGKAYTLEVYLEAEIDTIGDDFIPETTITKNNNGQHYRLSFTYGGPSAAPFVVVPTHIVPPNCHSESNGSIGVSVWGDQSNLFYNWSNVALNFFQQNGLPAGTYTVSVTGASYATSTTVVLNQPEPLIVQSANIQPVSCGIGQGSISIQPGGGSPPYQYLWSNGKTTATASFPSAGNYTLSLTDAHNCILVQTYNLPVVGIIQQNSSRQICTGQSIIVGGTTIQTGGIYQLQIPGNGTCDTLLTLTVTEVNPAALLAQMPSNITVSCNSPSVNLCSENAPDASYQWSKDGIPATQTPCLLATAGGVYTLTVQQSGCSAAKSIVSEEHLVGPIVTASGQADYKINCYVVDSTIIELSAGGSAIGPQYEWILQGQVISTAQTFVFAFAGGPNPFPPIPSVRVTDQNGCKNTAQPNIFSISPPFPPSYMQFNSVNLCLNLIEVELYILGANEPLTVTWNDSLVVDNKVLAHPGPAIIKVIDEMGCELFFNTQMPEVLHVEVNDAPYPNFPSGSIYIYEPTDADYTYLWEDGSSYDRRFDLSPGEYCVTITDVPHACAIDTCFTVQGMVSAPTPESASFQLMPNPLRPGDLLKIMLPEGFTTSDLTFELINSQGIKIQSENGLNSAFSQSFQLPAELPSGLYTVYIYGQHARLARKICVNK